jgi:hypothetical protein
MQRNGKVVAFDGINARGIPELRNTPFTYASGKQIPPTIVQALQSTDASAQQQGYREIVSFFRDNWSMLAH